VRIHLLHVAPSARTAEALAAMNRLIPRKLRDRTECHVRVGRPDEEIERYLGEADPELAVMGTHARHFWRRLFTRDTARQLLHGATCPVWFVPPTVEI
jgi:nucleotide-binding universal stress UspA family protein